MITDKKIAFLGGSITAGTGASAIINRYVNKTALRMSNTYPNYQIATLNAGLGVHGSWYGLVRLQADIISQSPDAVVIEYGVNDSDTDVDGKRTEEALIRRLKTVLNDIKLAMIFFTQVGNPAVNDPTNLNDDCKQNLITLCAYYGIPYADFAAELIRSVGAEEYTVSDYMVDTVHPKDLGHLSGANLLYAKTMPPFLDTFQANLPVTRLYDNGDYENTPIIRNGIDNDGETGSGWSTSGLARQSLTANDTIEWSGVFQSFGIDTNFGVGAGILAWSLDGGSYTNVDLSGFAYTNIRHWAGSRGSHTVKIKVVSGLIIVNRFLAI